MPSISISDASLQRRRSIYDATVSPKVYRENTNVLACLGGLKE